MRICPICHSSYCDSCKNPDKWEREKCRINQKKRRAEYTKKLEDDLTRMTERLFQYEKPVEMTKKQRDFIVEQVELGNNTEDGMHFWKTNGLFFNVNPDDMMRAWLNPKEVIKVVE